MKYSFGFFLSLLGFAVSSNAFAGDACKMSDLQQTLVSRVAHAVKASGGVLIPDSVKVTDSADVRGRGDVYLVSATYDRVSKRGVRVTSVTNAEFDPTTCRVTTEITMDLAAYKGAI